jgi:aspartyl-tRNA(Asn)/glutamyl-tRNA(Gln) amidotransferase subunit A
VDPKVGGYLSRNFQTARAEAERADVSLPLGGIPIAIKDVINVQGEPCTAASKILSNYTAPYNATVINKLRAAGAIPFGRLNLDEFAMGSSTENSAIQRTANPWDLTRIPGGSSGGSAAVVAADEAFASLGSDTGGSIRQPAALCGCVGMKPTYGRVSRFGLIAFASSLDQIGPFTKTVEDSARMLNVLAGREPQDSTSLELPAEDFTRLVGRDIKGLKIGMPKEYFIEGIDPQVDAAVRAAVRQYESLGAEIVEVSLPHTEYAVAVYYIIATAEASANLARYDGVRYGRRAEDVRNLQDLYIRSRSEGFGEEVKRRIILGTYVLSSGYYDAYYLRAQKVRTLIRQDFSRAFEKVDALICPTSPETAFKIGDRSDDPMKMYLADIFTIATNLAGIPGLSLPCGFAQVDGRPLPIGVQLLGKPLEEANLFQIAHAYEQSTPWHKARPTL